MGLFQEAIGFQLVYELVELQRINPRQESARGRGDPEGVSIRSGLLARHESLAHHLVDHGLEGLAAVARQSFQGYGNIVIDG